eukprot:84918_1
MKNFAADLEEMQELHHHHFHNHRLLSYIATQYHRLASPQTSPSVHHHPLFLLPHSTAPPPTPNIQYSSQQLYEEFCEEISLNLNPILDGDVPHIHSRPLPPPNVTANIVNPPPPPDTTIPHPPLPPDLPINRVTSQQLYEEFCNEISLNLNSNVESEHQPPSVDEFSQWIAHVTQQNEALPSADDPRLSIDGFFRWVTQIPQQNVDQKDATDQEIISPRRRPLPPRSQMHTRTGIEAFKAWQRNITGAPESPPFYNSTIASQQLNEDFNLDQNHMAPIDQGDLATTQPIDDELDESLIGRVSQQLSNWAHATHCLTQTPVKDKEIVNKQKDAD